MRGRRTWGHGGEEPGSTPFRTEVQHGTDGICIALFGELDLSTVVGLRSELRTAEAEGTPLIVLDLRGLQFMDSMGLGVLIGAVRRARMEKRRLVVVPGPKQIEALLRITGVDKMLDLAESPAAAGIA